MKELLRIRNSNWSMMGPGSWEQTEWIIYDDKSVKITDSYVESGNSETRCTLDDQQFDLVFKKLDEIKLDSMDVDACDGDAWEIVQYSDNKEVWKRNPGYIYGIKPFEELADLLRGLRK